MTHFTLARWLDFVRGVLPHQEHERMRGHLDAGCKRCARIVGGYRAVLALAREDHAGDVPEVVRERAKQVFSRAARDRAEGVFVRLLFDSLRQPLAVGVRDPRASHRQLLYRCGRYFLDLHDQRDAGASTAALLGQIVDSEQPSNLLAGLPVVLLSGNSVIARALTNELGEFHIEYRPGAGMKLTLMLEGETATVEIGPAPGATVRTRTSKASFENSGEESDTP